jgi:uncharacterized protein
MSDSQNFLDRYSKELIKTVLVQTLSDFKIEWLYLFGSAAQKTDTLHSDLDFAFYAHSDYAPYDIFVKAQEIAQQFHKEVDLVPLRTATTVFQKEVLSSGVVIWDSAPIQRQEFEGIVLKKYARLNEERALILKDQYGVIVDGG